jgi:hypothetical protein
MLSSSARAAVHFVIPSPAALHIGEHLGVHRVCSTAHEARRLEAIARGFHSSKSREHALARTLPLVSAPLQGIVLRCFGRFLCSNAPILNGDYCRMPGSCVALRQAFEDLSL